MLVKTSKKFEENFKNCSKVFYLHRNLILAVKDKTIEVFDQSKKLFEKEVQWPVEHAFYHKDVLYISTTEELIYLQVSESDHAEQKINSDQVIGVSAENVIHASAIVNGKLWVGMSKA